MDYSSFITNEINQTNKQIKRLCYSLCAMRYALCEFLLTVYRLPLT